MDFLRKEAVSVAVLIAVSSVLFLVGLGKMPLTDPDEVFYAKTAEEMLNRQEFLTPYIFGEPQFEKPPLYYWLVIYSFKFFGVNEFAARFPSALLGILGVLGIYFLGKLFLNRRSAFLGATIMATSVMYIVLARACVTDMLLCVLVLYSFLCYFLGYFAGKGKGKWYVLSSFFIALAVLTKGPIGLALPGAIILLYLLARREFYKIKEIPFFTCAAVLLAVSAPWYLLMYRAHGAEFLDVFFGFHNITRFIHPEHKIGDVFYYYFPILLGGFAPWAAFLPFGIWQAFKEKDEKARAAFLFFGIWICVFFAFFSVSRTKLPTYIFPLFPALPFFISRFFDRILSGPLPAKLKKYLNISSVAFFMILAGGLTGLWAVAYKKYSTIAGYILNVSILYTMIMLISLVLFFKNKYKQSAALFIVSLLVLVFPISLAILPEIGKYEASRHISEKVLTLMSPGEILGAETQYRRGVAFYTSRENVPDVHPHHVMTKLLAGDARAWLIIKDKNHRQLYTDKKRPFKTPTYLVYKFGKKVIVTNKVPPGVEYIKVRSINDAE